MFIENSVSTTHREVAVLIVTINEVMGVIGSINTILKTPEIERDMITSGVSELICSSFIRSIPVDSYIVALETAVFDKYRCFTNCNQENKIMINQLLVMLIEHVMDKVYSIVNRDNYVCVTSVIAGVTNNNDDRVFVITNVDLLKHNFIEIRYYNKGHSYGPIAH